MGEAADVEAIAIQLYESHVRKQAAESPDDGAWRKRRGHDVGILDCWRFLTRLTEPKDWYRLGEDERETWRGRAQEMIREAR